MGDIDSDTEGEFDYYQEGQMRPSELKWPSMSLVTPCQIGITPIQRRRRVAFFQSRLSGANFVLQEEEEEEAKVTTMKRRRQKQV